jgi:hypothetical protein
MKRKNMVKNILMIVVVIVMLVVGAIFYKTVKVRLEANNALTRFSLYKSLPLEKLSRLDFIDEKKLQTGKLEMSKHRVVFTGISRDNAKHLPEVMRHIEYIGQFFAEYRVIIFENDSTDATKLLLNLWKLFNSRVEIISQDFYNKKRPSIKFLADARNQYLEALKAQQYSEFDIVMPR